MKMLLTERSGTQHTADDLSDPSACRLTGKLDYRVVPRISAQDAGVSMGPRCSQGNISQEAAASCALCSCTPLLPPAPKRPSRASVEQVHRIRLLFAQAEIWPPRCCQHALAARERFAPWRGFSLTRSRAQNFTHVLCSDEVCPGNLSRRVQ
jgi:hypothetical protein